MHIRPVTQADLPDFANVVGQAMWDDEIMSYTAPRKNQYPDSFFRYCLHRAKIRFYRGEEMFVCVTDELDADWTGEETITGYCGYSTTVKSVPKLVRSGWLGNTFEQYALALYGRYAKAIGLDKSANPAAESHFRNMPWATAFDDYFGSLPEKHRERLGDQHWELEILGTHPSYRRRGIGRLMIEMGKKRAREDGVPLIVVASIIGEHLYLNCGFREVNRLTLSPDDKGASDILKDLDLGSGKGKGLAWATMVWEPESMGTDLG